MSDDTKTRRAVARALRDYHRTLWQMLDEAGAPTVNEDGIELLTVAARIEAFGTQQRDEKKDYSRRIMHARAAAFVEGVKHGSRDGSRQPTKAQPARRVLTVERVMEVRDELLETADEIAATEPENPAGLIRSAVTEFVSRIVLELDTTPERTRRRTCARCGHAEMLHHGRLGCSGRGDPNSANEAAPCTCSVFYEFTPLQAAPAAITDHPSTFGTEEGAQALRNGKPLEWPGETATVENGLLPPPRKSTKKKR